MASPSLSAPQLSPLPALEINSLSKTYPKQGRSPAKEALRDVSLKIPQGSMYALLGPNGAGKSTLINILAGLVRKSAGSAKIWGYDIDRDMRAARRSIGIVPQELNIDPFFTPRALLDIQAGMYGIAPSERRTDELLEILGLSDKAESYARSLSGGMRRRLMVAKAMVHNPPILILDEPTAGVDIDLRRQLWEQVKALNEQGTTILLTTHYLEEAEQLCDRIAIINHGQLVADETTQSLKQQFDMKEVIIEVDQPVETLPSSLRDQSLKDVEARLIAPTVIGLKYRPRSIAMKQLLASVTDAGYDIRDLQTNETDLEDVFLALTKAQS